MEEVKKERTKKEKQEREGERQGDKSKQEKNDTYRLVLRHLVLLPLQSAFHGLNLMAQCLHGFLVLFSSLEVTNVQPLCIGNLSTAMTPSNDSSNVYTCTVNT